MLFSQYYIKYFYGKQLPTEYLLQYTWQSCWVSNISVFYFRVVCIYICIYICIYTHTHTHTRLYICMGVEHLREEHKLWVFENRVPRKIFGGKCDDRTGEWRKMHNEMLCDVYSSPNCIRLIKPSRMRWAGNISWPLKMVPIGCPKTPVTNYHYSLRNDPEEHNSHLLRCGSLKSRLTFHCLGNVIFYH